MATPKKKSVSPFFVDPDISKAKTITTDFYTREKYFEASKEKIFASSWNFIGDVEMLDANHNIHPFKLYENFMDEPLVISKDKENVLRCLSNVCTHRGNIIADKSCTSANLRCKYHGRIFNLDGSFHSMPEFKEVKNFPSANDNLKEVPFYQWDKFMFVSLSKKIKPQSFLGDMMERMNWLPLKNFVYRPGLSKDYLVNAHWALYCENFLEGFHIPFVHSGLNEIIDFGSYKTELFKRSVLQIGYSKDKMQHFDLPESSPDYGKNIAAYYFFIFPNMMFNFYPWGLSVNVIKPVAIDKSVISFLTYVYDETKLNHGAGADLHKVEMEDEEVVQNVQRGIRSRFYNHGRYSVTREQGVHHFHRLIAEFLE
jgi:phenylpropionate dioxygenase-like ring-hydroxylating dioxygenase large terminal subunit